MPSNHSSEAKLTTAVPVYLIGNPNCGKTSLFNALTGEHQHVGNWPGVTVDRREGLREYEHHLFRIIDLPGTYSLFPHSPEEAVVVQILDEAARGLVVNVVDASTLERNLILTLQLLEVGIKPVIALNCIDLLHAQGANLDLSRLERELGLKIFPTVARTGEGVDKLLSWLTQRPSCSDSSSALTEAWRKSAEQLLQLKYQTTWTQASPHTRLESIRQLTDQRLREPELQIIQRHLSATVTPANDHPTCPSLAGSLASERAHRIEKLVLSCITAGTCGHSATAWLDHFLTHAKLGYPLFFLLMAVVFWSTFTLGAIPGEWIKSAMSALGAMTQSSMGEGILRDLLTDGIIAGIGGVLSFLPGILVLFFWLALLEDSGYMARAAFLMDRPMRFVGLDGRAFLPLLMGYGCNVPAIMATRILNDPQHRLLSILLLPLIGCSARLPVLVMFCGAFFPSYPGTILFALYLLNLAVFLVSALVLQRFFTASEYAPFLLEMPSYRLPTLKSVIRLLWEKCSHFLKKAGTIIVLGSIFTFCLGALPREVPLSQDFNAHLNRLHTLPEDQKPKNEIERLIAARDQEIIEKRYLGRLGRTLEPFVRPLGFSWREAISLIPGFLAKESIVATLGVLYRPIDADTGKAMVKAGMKPLNALVFMIFTLLYVPCLATIGTIWAETRSWFYTTVALVFPCVIAWSAAFIVFQVGLLFS